MKFDVEVGFISKLLQTKDILTVKDNQIKAEFFTGDNRAAFDYIYENVMDNGEVPSVRAFKQQFPRYTLEQTTDDTGKNVVGTEENLTFWCNELKKKVRHNFIADTVEKAATKLQDYESEDAYTLIKKSIAYIESEVTDTTDVDITKDTESRKEAYLKKKNNKGMQGLPTGFSKLDYITKGLKDSTLTTVIANTGIGKRLDLRTPILTPDGFVPLRDIHVGSTLFDENGEMCKVIKETPVVNTQVYRVHFEDGTSVDCCKDHLWKFKTIDDLIRDKPWRVATTEQLLKRPLKRGRGFNLMIPVAKPIQFPKKDLPIDPYALGCLLGDGGFTTDNISFTNVEEDVLSKVSDKLSPLVDMVKHTNIQYVFYKKQGDPINQLNSALRGLNLWGHNSLSKFIPEMYLQGSVSQRIALLQGLIDTDGHIDAKGHISFFTSSKQLKTDVINLIRSLGVRCSCSEYIREGKPNVEYVVRIWCDCSLFFTSKKHNKKYKERKLSNSSNHYEVLKITNIEVLDSYVDMKCLMVDSPEHTFICGDFIVTHNTWLEIIMGSYLQLQNYRVLQCVTEMSEDIMRDRYEAMLFAMCYGEDFNYNAFKSGALDLKTEKLFFEFLENDLPNFEPLYITTATGVMGLSADIDKYNPDVIFIDSAYLMEDDQGAKDDWLRVAHITRDLKKLAKRCKKPILINTQADKNTSKKTGPELGSIMYTQAIGQDSDDVWALFRDEVMINDKEMALKVLKQREGILGKLLLNWNFDVMDFSEIYADTNEQDFDADGDSDESTHSSKDNTLDIMEEQE